MTLENRVNITKTKPFDENGTEEPTKGPISQPVMCEWYLIFRENPESMNKEAMKDFIKRHGCYRCEGYKNAKCGGRA